MGRNIKRCYYWMDTTRLEDFESWLTDMSSKGWELKRINKLFATFEKKSMPQNNFYRFEVIERNDRTTEDRIELYHQAGWEHVAVVTMIHIFRAGERAEKIEIHTDPVVQANTLKKLQKRIFLYTLLMVIISCLEVGMSFYSYNSDRVGFFIESSNTLYPIVISLSYIFISYITIHGLINIKRLIRKLKSGIPFEHKANFKKRLYRWTALQIVFISLEVAGLIFMIIAVRTDGRMLRSSPPIPSGTLPVLSMTDILPNTKLVPNTFFDPDGYFTGDQNNYSKISGSVLLPVQYELQQSDTVPGINWDDNSGTYSPSIKSDEFEAITPFVARVFFQTLLNEYKNDPVYLQGYSMSQVQSGLFDSLWKFDDTRINFSHMLLALKSNKIYEVDYTAMVPVEKVIQLLEQKALQN